MSTGATFARCPEYRDRPYVGRGGKFPQFRNTSECETQFAGNGLRQLPRCGRLSNLRRIRRDQAFTIQRVAKTERRRALKFLSARLSLHCAPSFRGRGQGPLGTSRALATGGPAATPPSAASPPLTAAAARAPTNLDPQRAQRFARWGRAGVQ